MNTVYPRTDRKDFLGLPKRQGKFTSAYTDLQTVQIHRSSSKAETPGSGNHDKRNMYMPVY